MTDPDEILEPVEVVDPAPSASPLALTKGLVDADAQRALATVDRRIAFYTQVRARSVKLTLPQDWVDQNGKPYLMGSGTERLKALWGIYVKPGLRISPDMAEVRRALKSREHVTVTVIGTAGSAVTGEESEFVGARSSDDAFFSDRRGGVETVDPADLVKAAVTNFEVQAITRLLGFRGMTWADLEEYGIRQDQAAKVTYRPGGETQAAAAVTGAAAEIREKLEAMSGEHALEQLYILTKFQGKDGQEQGIKSWGQLAKSSEKWVQRTLEKVRREHETWAAKQ